MSHTLENLNALLARRILVIDGAMGTMIQRYKLTEEDYRGLGSVVHGKVAHGFSRAFNNHPKELKGNADVLNLTRPDVISAIHHEYLEAGADIIETNTFNAQAISQADYALEPFVRDLNVAGARLAREAADAWMRKTPDRLRFVAGSIGPTNRALSISPNVDDPAFRAVTFHHVREAYAEQVRGLLDGGVDLILVETIFDTLNAKAALVAIQDVYEERKKGAVTFSTGQDTGIGDCPLFPPVMISVTITDRSGRTLSGQTIDAFYISVEHVKPVSVGMNCALGARDMRAYLAELAALARCWTSAYPNAGLPNAFGQYDEQPADTSALLR
ncbi:MAG: homocysteine S-methyltransferase family protein, partial [Vicinamibacterales bacterium]